MCVRAGRAKQIYDYHGENAHRSEELAVTYRRLRDLITELL
jgi:hypothetical protein